MPLCGGTYRSNHFLNEPESDNAKRPATACSLTNPNPAVKGQTPATQRGFDNPSADTISQLSRSRKDWEAGIAGKTMIISPSNSNPDTSTDGQCLATKCGLAANEDIPEMNLEDSGTIDERTVT
jgi:hypothetical protein